MGQDLDFDALARMASRPENFYVAPDAAQLADIYRGIAVALPCAPYPEAFLRSLLPANVALTGRAAHQLTRESQLSSDFVEGVRAALVERSRDPAADLRARIEAARVLGKLGDPRFLRHHGPAGDYLVPPLAELPAGTYPIGDDEPVAWVGGTTRAHMPRHKVALPAFRLGRFPVTNAEFDSFVAAGGYEDERWWETAAARDWRRGIGTAAGMHASFRHWAEKFRADPGIVDDYLARGNWNEELYERWQKRLAMTDEQFTAMLFDLHPELRFSEPKHWREERFNHPAQPVTGVSWYEARAYCAWLSHRSGEPYRLPTEVEWEAAARGPASRAYAYGTDFDPLAANTAATKLRRPSPVGVFVEGDTPEGVSDLTGNVDEWMSSAFGRIGDEAEFAYPYSATDGREDPDLGPAMRRVVRGGSWMVSQMGCLATCRNDDLPDFRLSLLGFRLVQAVPAGP